MTSVEDLKRKWMRNPEFRKAYEASADTYAKQAKVIEKMKTLGPLEPAALASAEPLRKPPRPLRPGNYVRETELDRNGHPSRRKYGTVSQVRGLMVGVMFRGEGIEAWVFPDELEAAERKPKGASRKRMERENERLKAVIAAVVEERQALKRCAENGTVANSDAWIVAANGVADALAPFEREPT